MSAKALIALRARYDRWASSSVRSTGSSNHLLLTDGEIGFAEGRSPSRAAQVFAYPPLDLVYPLFSERAPQAAGAATQLAASRICDTPPARSQFAV